MLTALVVLVLILLLLGGGGLVLNVLWYVLIAALVLWALGFLVRLAEGGRWYYW
jgi:hypothetical protein